MGELTTKKQNLPKKAAIGQYVHDMLDLEIRAHSLRKTAEETRKKAKEEERNAESLLNYAKKEKERAFDRWQAYENYLENGEVSSGASNAGAVAALFFGLPTLIAGIYHLASDYGETITGIICTIIGIIILGGYSCYRISLYNSALESGEKELTDIENAYHQSEKTLATRQSERKQIQIYVQKLRAHADQLDKDIAEIEKSLQHNYALNIVPPDYRRLECLLWIDYAFRNDQVDTMREATLQCDKQLFRRKVGDSLQILAETVRSIGELLETMNTNISMMNQDLFRIAEAQEKKLSETQSARYAMESVEQGVDRLAFYEEMKRHGTF